MKEYHKIQTVFKRNPETKFRTLLEGEYSMPEFEYLKNNTWIFTEKVDGTNIRIKCNPYQENGKAFGIVFMGKSDDAQIPKTLYTCLENKFHSDFVREKITEIFPNGACLYGEGYGAKIQKGGGNYRQDQGFVLFDIKIGDLWLKREAVEDITKRLGIGIIPIIDIGTLSRMVELVRNGFDSVWGKFKAEGIVARPSTELKTRRGDRIITKIKCKDFSNVHNPARTL